MGNSSRSESTAIAASIVINVPDTLQTIVSMTPIFLHINPDIFPNPHSFLPERWLNLSENQRQRLEHYLVPYSKGSRQCSGLRFVPSSVQFAPKIKD